MWAQSLSFPMAQPTLRFVASSDIAIILNILAILMYSNLDIKQDRVSGLFIFSKLLVKYLDICLDIVSRLLRKKIQVIRIDIIKMFRQVFSVSKLKMKKGLFVHYFDTNFDIVSKLMLMDIFMVNVSMKRVNFPHVTYCMVKRMVIMSMLVLKKELLKMNFDMNLDIVSKLKVVLVMIVLKIKSMIKPYHDINHDIVSQFLVKCVIQTVNQTQCVVNQTSQELCFEKKKC